MQTLGGGEGFTVLHIGAPVEVIGLHKVHGLQFLLLIGGDEACPCSCLTIQYLYGVAPHISHSFRYKTLIVTDTGEILVIGCHEAAIGGLARLVSHLLGILRRGAHIEQQRVAGLQQGGYQFLQQVTLRVGKGRFDISRNRQHFVTDEIDRVLLHGIPTTGQHLGRARDIEFLAIDLHRTTHAGAQALHALAAHSTHGDGILHKDVIRHSDIDIRIHAHFLHIVTGGYFLRRLQFVLVTPVGVVLCGQVKIEFKSLVG